MEGAKFQSWNSHTKKYCVFGEDGKLKTQVSEALPGVEIRKEKPAAAAKKEDKKEPIQEDLEPDLSKEIPKPKKTRNSIFSKLFKKSGSDETTAEADSFLSDW